MSALDIPAYAGPWHNVTAADIRPEGDPDMDLGIEVEHLPNCDPDDDIYGGCDLGMEQRANGHDRFPITEPGSYRVRFVAERVQAVDGYMEWETSVEVEPLTEETT